MPAEEMPLVFAGLDRAGDRFDEPCSAIVDRERWLASRGGPPRAAPGLHLTGFGGDELLYGSVAHLYDLAAAHPRARAAAAARVRREVPLARRSVLRQLADSRPYGTWLAGTSPDTLTAPRPPATEPLLEWGFRPRLPPWATAEAVSAVTGQDHRRGRRRAAVGPPRPAPGAGDDALPVPDDPAVRASWPTSSG